MFALDLLFCLVSHQFTSYFTNIERPCSRCGGVLSHIDANNHSVMNLAVQQVFIQITVRYFKKKEKQKWIREFPADKRSSLLFIIS